MAGSWRHRSSRDACVAVPGACRVAVLGACRVAVLGAVLLLSGCSDAMVTGEIFEELEIAETRVPCWGEHPQTCFLARRPAEEEFSFFYGEITGFDFEPGFRARIEVGRTVDPPFSVVGPSYGFRMIHMRGRLPSPRLDLLQRIQAAEAAWLQARPDRYIMELERRCFCGAAARGPVLVEAAPSARAPAGGLHEDRLSVHYTADRSAVQQQLADLFPTVQGLFSILRLAIAHDAHRIDVDFDEAAGYPRRVFIDHRAAIADDEIEYLITSIEPRRQQWMLLTRHADEFGNRIDQFGHDRQ